MLSVTDIFFKKMCKKQDHRKNGGLIYLKRSIIDTITCIVVAFSEFLLITKLFKRLALEFS